MSISFKSRVSVPDYVLVRTFENESVLLNLENEAYHGLDDVGTRMWQRITQAETIQAAYETLLSEYNVDEATLRHDIIAFINNLLERDLVKISNDKVA